MRVLILTFASFLFAVGGYISPLIPGPDLVSYTPAKMHKIVSYPCVLQVLVLEDVPGTGEATGAPQRRPVASEWSWFYDPSTCDVVVTFASPQTNYYVVVK